MMNKNGKESSKRHIIERQGENSCQEWSTGTLATFWELISGDTSLLKVPTQETHGTQAQDAKRNTEMILLQQAEVTVYLRILVS